LVIKSPGKGDIRIIANGKKVAQSIGTKMEYMPKENGLYRIEIYKGDRGWIYSNHIRIGI
jgi:ABC-type uncharacterized transport system ATPase subunit